jgi:aerobic-type carbon monoxide dehydrogenase small subunit (CoxS/CutS family)
MYVCVYVNTIQISGGFCTFGYAACASLIKESQTLSDDTMTSVLKQNDVNIIAAAVKEQTCRCRGYLTCIVVHKSGDYSAS